MAAKLCSSCHTGCLLGLQITSHNQHVFGSCPAWRLGKGRCGGLASESLYHDTGDGWTHTQVSCRWDGAMCEQDQGDLEGREHCGPGSKEGWSTGEGLQLTLRAKWDFGRREGFLGNMWACCVDS